MIETKNCKLYYHINRKKMKILSYICLLGVKGAL